MRKFSFQLELNQICVLPQALADHLLASRNGDAALLALHLIRTDGVLDESAVKTQLGFTDSRLETAVACLLRVGCITETTAGVLPPQVKTVLPEKTEPVYTAAELQHGLREDAMFKWLCRETESRLGRILKQYELETLYSLYDYLGMPAEVIVMLIGYLAASRQDRVNQGQTVPSISFRQISREANLWTEHGINTAEKADAHIKYLQQRKSVLGQAMYAVGIRDRAASPGEQRYLNAWLDAGAAVDLIAKAYDLTVLKKGSLNWPYMRSIVERWLSRGYRTAADTEMETQNPSASGKPQQPGFDSEYAARIRAHKAQRENA